MQLICSFFFLLFCKNRKNEKIIIEWSILICFCSFYEIELNHREAKEFSAVIIQLDQIKAI